MPQALSRGGDSVGIDPAALSLLARGRGQRRSSNVQLHQERIQ